jgi:hypothetical protein
MTILRRVGDAKISVFSDCYFLENKLALMGRSPYNRSLITVQPIQLKIFTSPMKTTEQPNSPNSYP